MLVSRVLVSVSVKLLAKQAFISGNNTALLTQPTEFLVDGTKYYYNYVSLKAMNEILLGSVSAANSFQVTFEFITMHTRENRVLVDGTKYYYMYLQEHIRMAG